MSSFPADDEHRGTFEAAGIAHDVYASGRGPGVLIMHELPGMTPECLRLAGLVVEAGYRVYLPLFFGKPGQRPSQLGSVVGGVGVCLRREFRCLAAGEDSPITPWLRGLCRKIYAETKDHGAGIGVIGMCLTGNVVLALMLEESVVAPVMCQPGLPLVAKPLPGAATRGADLGVSGEVLAQAARRAATVPLSAYRFETDPICPRERFDTLRRALGSGVRAREIPTGPQNPGKIPNGAHAILTKHFVDEPGHPTRLVLDEILQRFEDALRA